MKFAALIYNAETSDVDPSDPAFKEVMDNYQKFGANNEKNIEGGEALAPTAMATSVQVRNGETLTTDGPFAETKEQLGGFYIVDCENLDEAINVASQIPGAWSGTVEVRPVLDFS